MGKAYARGIIRKFRRQIASTMKRTQFGGLPGRGTRDAVAIVVEILKRFKLMNGATKAEKSKLRIV
eukprot:2490314-Karenia_brevis.AAC.1